MALIEDKVRATKAYAEWVYMAIIIMMACASSLYILWPELVASEDRLTYAAITLILPALACFSYFQMRRRKELIESYEHLQKMRYGAEGKEAEDKLIKHLLSEDSDTAS